MRIINGPAFMSLFTASLSFSMLLFAPIAVFFGVIGIIAAREGAGAAPVAWLGTLIGAIEMMLLFQNGWMLHA